MHSHQSLFLSPLLCFFVLFIFFNTTRPYELHVIGYVCSHVLYWQMRLDSSLYRLTNCDRQLLLLHYDLNPQTVCEAAKRIKSKGPPGVVYIMCVSPENIISQESFTAVVWNITENY